MLFSYKENMFMNFHSPKFLVGLLSIVLLFQTVSLSAQAPGTGIFFQAVARDNFSNPAKDRKIYVQSSIVQGTATGAVVLSEVHETTTDGTGVFSISIGQGTRSGGLVANLTAVPWANGPFYLNLKIAITPTAPIPNWDYTKDWIDLGTTPFGTVPYALYSGSSGALDTKLNIADTSKMLALYARAQIVQSLSTAVASKISTTDTAAMLAPYKKVVNELVASNITSLTASAINGALDSKVSLIDSGLVYVTPAQLKSKTFDSTSIYSNLALKELTSNKSTSITTDSASDLKYPSVKSVKSYVDTQIAGATIADADATTKGKIQIAGDLSGTAAAPSIATDAVTTTKIKDANVTTAKLKDAAITTAKINDAAITEAKINDAAISTSKIADANVTDAKIVSVSGSKILGNIAGNAATATKIASAVTINGVAFDGSSNITIASAAANGLTMNNSGTGDISGTVFDGSAAKTISYNTIGASPLAGSSSLTTVGTITSGVWSGTAIDVSKGGTGLTSIPAGQILFGNGAGAIGSNSNLFWDNTNGTFGVGTNTPGNGLNTKFDVVGRASFRTNNTNGGIIVDGNPGSFARIYTDATTGTPDNLVLGTYPNGHMDQLFLKQSNGFVGIKNSNPTTALDVNGTITATLFAGPLTGNVTGDIAGNLNGNATTATTAGNITATSNNTLTSLPNLTTVGTITSGVWSGTAIADSKLATITSSGKVNNSATTATDANTASAIVARDVSGNFTASTITGTLSGTASKAIKLAATKNINGVAFDGSSDITIVADANTLTGTTLANNIVSSSLTSVGTITSGTWSASVIDIAHGGTGSSIKNFVDLTSAQTIAGAKTFNNTATFNTDATINGLTVGLGTGSQSSNAVLGKTAMLSNTTGNNTVAIGFEALKANTFSNYNTAIGSYALSANNNADANVAVGVYALTASQNGGYNTAVGSNSLAANISGYQNAALGNTSLFTNTSGNYNTAVGNRALYSNTTGSNNTAIGNSADVASNNLTNATAIGNGAIVNASNTIQLGNSSVTSLVTSGTVSATGFTGPLTGNVTGNLTGNAATATKLAATKNINGVAFDGSADVTIAANSNTLTGTILSSNVVSSSLTSVGTITSGTWSASIIDIAHGGTATNTAAGALVNLGAEPTANKSTATDLGNTNPSDEYFPSQKAVKTYVDAKSAAAGVADLSITNAKLAGSITASKLVGTDITTVGTITAGIWSGTAIDIAHGGTGSSTVNGAKTNLGLNNVENTALSTWAGSTNITSVGNISAISKSFMFQDLTLGYGTPNGAKIQTDANNKYISFMPAYGVESTRLWPSGNVTIQHAGTFTDNGYTLEVGGNSSITGNLNVTGNITGATWSGTTIDIAHGGTGSTTKNFVDLTSAQTIAGTKTFSNTATFNTDISLNGLTVGLGNGQLSSNAAFGASVLGANTTGYSNAAFGGSTLTSNTTGFYNTAIGKDAMHNNTTGSENTGIGLSALYSNVSGGYNTALGSSALVGNTTASYNVAIGRQALGSTTTGGNNVAIGAGSLTTNATGTNNTAIGNSADVASAALNNATAIGSGAIVSASNTIQLGNTSVADVFTSGIITATGFKGPLAGNITGNAATATKLAASKNINGVAFDGSADITIASAAGTLSGTTLASNVVSSSLTSVGTITSGTWSGSVIDIAHGGTGSTTKNYVDLTTTQTIDGAKTFTGTTTFSKDVTVNGIQFGIGGGAIGSNMIMGNFENGMANTTGSDNVILSNRGFRYNTTGSHNLGLGYYTLRNNSTGSYNVAIGENTLTTNTTGTYLTAIGNGANSADGLTNATAIGNGAYVTTSNTIQLGNGSVTKVNTTGDLVTSGNVSASTFNGVLLKNGGGSISSNVAFGNSNTLNGNTSGTDNFAFGQNTLMANTTGSNNIILGTEGLRYNTSGGHNIGLGYYSLRNNNTGNYNIAIGENTITSNTTGSNLTAIGYGADIADGLSNATAIGNGASVTASNTIQLGNTSVTDVKTAGTITAAAFKGPLTGNASTATSATTATTAGNITATSNTTLTSLANLATVGTITSGTWSGSVIGSNVGGAGTVNGLLKANGAGVVSAAVAGTDYFNPNGTNIKIGYVAGGGTQGAHSIAIGSNAAQSGTQADAAVAIGYAAGQNGQGANSVAIGAFAGNSQGANSIALNASGNALSPSNSGFYVDPVNNASTSSFLFYNTTTKEITYNAIPTLNQNTTGNATTATTAGNVTATSNTTLTSLANLATVGTITSGTWSGSVIGSNVGGAGTVSGLMKANGSGLVSAAVAGTDYQAPYANLTNIGSISNSAGYLKNIGTGTFTYVGSITDADLSTITTAGKVSNTATSATAANTASAIVARDASGNFSAGTITGTLSGTANFANGLTTGRTISTTGDVTYTSGAFDGTAAVTGVATLAASGVASGTYGSSTAIPVLTVDTKGRVTSASTVSIVAGVNTMTAIAATSNANGATISGTALTLTPADASNGGIITAATQTIGGAKTFSNTTTFNKDITVSGLTVGVGKNGLSVTTNNTALGINALAGTNSGTGANTAIGNSALTANTSGNNNTAVGNIALYTNSTGNGNSSFGNRSMYLSETGDNNSAFGASAYANGVGGNNTAIGNSALSGPWAVGNSGNDNVGLGYSAGAGLTTGNKNLFLGNNAGYNISSSSNNIFLGYKAGYYYGTAGNTNNTTGAGSVMIGYDVRPQSDGQSNQVVIAGYTGAGYGVTGLGSNTTLIGNSATTKSQIYGALTTVPAAATTNAGENSTIEAQGTTSGSAAGGNVILKGGNNSSSGAGGNINLTPGTSSSGTAGKVIANTDMTINGITAGRGLGNLASNTVFGSTALATNTSGYNNTAIGVNALNANLTTWQNTAVGFEALKVNTASNNTAIGTSVLAGNITGTLNSALGNLAMFQNTSGNNNSAFGAMALRNNYTGSDNIAFGQSAGSNLSGSQNVYLGSNAGIYNTSVSNNILIGYGAGQYYGSGSNTNNNLTGNGNVLIGNNVRPLADGQTNQVVIAGYTSGDGMIGNGSNTVTIGNTSNTANYLRGTTNINTGTSTQTLGINLTGSVDDFLEMNVKNTSATSKSQSGYNAMSDVGDDYNNFVWMGINSSTFSNTTAYNIGGANDVSFLGKGNDMYVANSNSAKSIIFSTGAASPTYFAERMRISPTGNVGIGTNSPTTTLHVAGSVRIVDNNQGAGKVLTSDANGLASWTNSIGSSVLTSTAAYAITLAEAYVFYNGTAAGTFTIPAAASTNAGKEITIKNKSAYGITITPLSSGTIYVDNAMGSVSSISIGIEASNNWIKLVSDGTQWNVLRALF